MPLFSKNNGKTEGENSPFLNLKRIFLGVLLGFAVYFFLTFVFAFIMTFSSVPDGSALVFSFAAVATASFLAGFFALWNIGNNGLLNGLVCGAILSVFHLSSSLIFGDGDDIIYLIISVAIEIVLSTLGGIISVNARCD